MRVIIVEDEISACENMKALLKEIDANIEILAFLQSINETVSWIERNPAPDLAFFDIRIADGLSFEIFERTEVKFPIVFTTAYNDYALKAFKVNSIDYLLKPIRKSEVEFAINKYKKVTASYTSNQNLITTLQTIRGELSQSFKQTILVKKHDGFVPLQVNEIAFFFIENGINYIQTLSNKKFVYDEKMDAIEKQLSPNDFYRANRQFLISRCSITEVKNYFNGRLSVHTNPTSPDKILISKVRVSEFKQWLER